MDILISYLIFFGIICSETGSACEEQFFYSHKTKNNINTIDYPAHSTANYTRIYKIKI